jgi:hypothetical protein
MIIVGCDHYILFGTHCLPRYVIGTGDVDGPIDRLPGLDRGAVRNHEALATLSNTAMGTAWTGPWRAVLPSTIPFPFRTNWWSSRLRHCSGVNCRASRCTWRAASTRTSRSSVRPTWAGNCARPSKRSMPTSAW